MTLWLLFLSSLRLTLLMLLATFDFGRGGEDVENGVVWVRDGEEMGEVGETLNEASEAGLMTGSASQSGTTACCDLCCNLVSFLEGLVKDATASMLEMELFAREKTLVRRFRTCQSSRSELSPQ